MRLGDRAAMSTATVLIAADQSGGPDQITPGPRYTLLLSTDPALVEAAQRPRHGVFTSEPGFSLAGAADGRDADRFDEYCDHLLVREDESGELVGCYRMLPPPVPSPPEAFTPPTVHPYRPVTVDGRGLDDIVPPARVAVPALMRGYLRLGAQICGDPVHDPDFGVGDFPALLDKRQADIRYLKRLRSVGAATAMADGIAS
jgi:putative hemolysin